MPIFKYDQKLNTDVFLVSLSMALNVLYLIFFVKKIIYC